MIWSITKNFEEYLAEAGDFLRADPTENTVPLSVAETLRAQGTGVYGVASALFGWWRSDAGEVGGIFLHTRPYPLLLSAVPEQAARELAEVLAGRQMPLPGATGDRLMLSFHEGRGRLSPATSAPGRVPRAGGA